MFEKFGCFNMNSADEMASDRKAGKRDESDEENRDGTVYRDTNVGFEKVNEKYPTRRTAVENDDEAFDGEQRPYLADDGSSVLAGILFEEEIGERGEEKKRCENAARKRNKRKASR